MKKKEVMDILKNAYVSSLNGAGGLVNLFIYGEDSAEEVEAEIHRKAKQSKRPFRIRKGPVQFYRDEPIVDFNKTGSAQYIWAKDMDRVKHDRILITKNADGTITETKVGTVYKLEE